MKIIRCVDLHGQEVEVNVDSLEYRPAVYGLVVENGKLLVYRSKNSGTLMLPGGQVEKGERMREALAREVREEVGMEIERAEFFYADDDFYFNEIKNQGYQVYCYYYFCQLKKDQAGIIIHPGAEVTDFQWVPVATLRTEDFHVSGREPIRRMLEHLQHVQT